MKLENINKKTKQLQCLNLNKKFYENLVANFY